MKRRSSTSSATSSERRERRREPHHEQRPVAPTDAGLVVEHARELAQLLDDDGRHTSTRSRAEAASDPLPHLTHLGCVARRRVAGEAMRLADRGKGLRERGGGSAVLGPRGQIERERRRRNWQGNEAVALALRLEPRPLVAVLVAVRVTRALGARGTSAPAPCTSACTIEPTAPSARCRTIRLPNSSTSPLMCCAP